MTGRRWMFLLISFSVAAFAQAIEASPDVAVCAGCHGAKGEGNQAIGAPRLAGQDAAYLERQLQNFKAGRRAYHSDDKTGAVMRPVTGGLSDTDIHLLAERYHRMTIETTPVKIANQGSVQAGKSLYVTTCSSCHGLQAQGYPQLRAPNPQYLGRLVYRAPDGQFC